MQEEEETGDSMKQLENRTEASKRFVNVNAISAFGSALGSSNETLVIQSAMCLHSLAHDDVARGLMLENGYRSLSEPSLNQR